jgi:hypothetical protein
MALTLIITDNADGTGSVATIAGAVISDTVTLYASAWTGEMKSYPMSSVGTRTGDGTIAVATPGTLALGFYVWQAVVTTGTPQVSNVYYQNVTSPAIAVHDLIMDCVQERIRSLNLTDIPANQIFKRWFPRVIEGAETLPLVMMSPTLRETYPVRLLNQDDVGYPVVVCIVAKQNLGESVEMNRNLLWRERIAKALRSQRLPGVLSVLTCEIEYDTVADEDAALKQHFLSAIVFRFVNREDRGLT